MSFGLETGELPNPEAPWAWRSSAVAAGVPWGSFCHNCILSLTHTSKGTFLSLAAPVPERMASIKACLASTGLPRGPELDLDADWDEVGAWATGAGGGGWDWTPRPSACKGSGPCADKAALRRLWSSSEAEDVTFLRLQVPLWPRMAARRAERSQSASV